MPGAQSSPDITVLLLAWNAGDEDAFDQLVPLVHAELKRLAVRYMAGEREDHTLQASAIVNEAYLKLLDTRRVRWRNRTHFFALSARLMRRILVDFARRNHYQKRGGGAQKLPIEEKLLVTKDRVNDLVSLDDALTALS